MIVFSPEQDQYLQLSQSRAYYEGLRDGVRMFAIWKDGVEYVGSTGTTLSDAISKINAQEQDLLSKFKIVQG